MQLFYLPDIPNKAILSKEESFHCLKVLRYKKDKLIHLTDGNGNLFSAIIEDENKEACSVRKIKKLYKAENKYKIHLVVAPPKSFEKTEWMIEKISEIGVDKVTFIYSQHSERRKIKLDRLEKISIAAMKQSNSLKKLKIEEITSFQNFLTNYNTYDEKYIAHMDKKNKPLKAIFNKNKNFTILIGPEGDFSSNEIEEAYKKGFKGINLGKNTLKTETASIIACYSIIQLMS